MPDPPPIADPSDAGGVRSGDGSTTGMPRWVKVSAIIAVVLIVLVVVVMLAGGHGGHGPGRHT